MHCVDKSFAVFSILPPYNVVDAQVVRLSGPPAAPCSSTRPRWTSATPPPPTRPGRSTPPAWARATSGSSRGALRRGALAGRRAPGHVDAGRRTDHRRGHAGLGRRRGALPAPGIPIFPLDDAGQVNRYPLMRFSALDKAGKVLGSHRHRAPGLGGDLLPDLSRHRAGRPPPAGAGPGRPIRTWRRSRAGTCSSCTTPGPGPSLTAPVLCASCHYSPALDLAGDRPLGRAAAARDHVGVMHAFHADKMAGLVDAPVASGGAVPSAAATQACYQCHPGATTQCLRGAMTTEVDCQNCHGGMAAVGGGAPLRAGGSVDGANDGHARRPWLDLPRCQSCHANDAVAKTTVAGAPPLAARRAALPERLHRRRRLRLAHPGHHQPLRRAAREALPEEQGPRRPRLRGLPRLHPRHLVRQRQRRRRGERAPGPRRPDRRVRHLPRLASRPTASAALTACTPSARAGSRSHQDHAEDHLASCRPATAPTTAAPPSRGCSSPGRWTAARCGQGDRGRLLHLP